MTPVQGMGKAATAKLCVPTDSEERGRETDRSQPYSKDWSPLLWVKPHGSGALAGPSGAVRPGGCRRQRGLGTPPQPKDGAGALLSLAGFVQDMSKEVGKSILVSLLERNPCPGPRLSMWLSGRTNSLCNAAKSPWGKSQHQFAE